MTQEQYLKLVAEEQRRPGPIKTRKKRCDSREAKQEAARIALIDNAIREAKPLTPPE